MNNEFKQFLSMLSIFIPPIIISVIVGYTVIMYGISYFISPNYLIYIGLVLKGLILLFWIGVVLSIIIKLYPERQQNWLKYFELMLSVLALLVAVGIVLIILFLLFSTFVYLIYS